jgi:hypothetical protein
LSKIVFLRSIGPTSPLKSLYFSTNISLILPI